MKRGELAPMRITNRWDDQAITCHWHGLGVSGDLDGGPHVTIAPGATWAPELEVDQPAATLWYHSHVHARTAEHVYAGLAGMLLVDDPSAPDPGLPRTWGVDDIPLIIQDRAFEEGGAFAYANRGPARMHGFRGDHMLVNGAIRPEVDVPMGLTRFRVLNASNARTYTLRFADGRTFHQVASDGGLLPAPVPLAQLVLAPAERVEVVVDFAQGGTATLVSEGDPNEPPGMMGPPGTRFTPPPSDAGAEGEFDIMTFRADPSRPAQVRALPARLAGAPTPPEGPPARRREFVLDVHGGGGMGAMGGGRGRGMGMMGGGMTINGVSMDMGVINERVRRGEPEVWEIVSQDMAHPFHVHGGNFRVLSNNGTPVPYETSGLKDVVLVDGRAEILVRFDHEAGPSAPYMYHCHILEHEDAGMMGQFTVAP